MRTTQTDTNSEEANNSVSSDWELTLKDPCYDDQLAITSNIGDFNFNINAASVSKSLTISKS
jgi:hypothetical protein